MKIRCVNNTGIALRPYEYEPISDNEIFGRFGTNGNADYEMEVGKEYFVMGIIIFQKYQAYLIDDNGFIFTAPCQLFESLDNELSSTWQFRIIDKNEEIYPFMQAILGYPELCSDKEAYANLIVEMEEAAQRTYFRRKIELERGLEENL